MNFEHGRRRVLKQLAGGAGALALTRGGAALAQQGDTLRVGAILPLSGPLQIYGNAVLNGARVAAEQINRTGGVLGQKIEIVARDDKASPAEAALVARDIFGSGIKFIIGGLLTAPSMPIINLLAENNALFFLTGSQIMGMTHENFNPNVFRCQLNARMNLYAMASAMPKANPNVTRWGGITPDNQFGIENYKNFMAGLRKAYKEQLNKTIEVADPVLVAFPATDFKLQISKIMASPVEGFYSSEVGTDYFTMMAQAKQLGMYSKLKTMVEAGSGVVVAKGLGANLPKDNLWTMTTWYPYAKDANAVSKAYARDYTAMTGDPNLENINWPGHTAMLALATAIRNAKSLEIPVVRVALERLEIESVSGPFHFRREDHQGIMNISVFKFQQTATPPGWEVGRIIVIKGEDVVEPAAPGKPYVIES
jgi:branched-chain amino acid transport system substrate-binding protein